MALPITLPISLPLELPIAFTFNVTKHCSDYFCKTLAAGVANGDTNGVDAACPGRQVDTEWYLPLDVVVREVSQPRSRTGA